MRKFILKPIFAILLFYGCDYSCNTHNMRVLNVKLSDKELNVNENFKKIEFLPLETCQENLVRNMTKAFFVDSLYVIFSSAPDNVISVHDKEGHFIRTIGSVGKGPAEFVSLLAMSVDENINVYDRGKTMVHTYGKEGEYISSLKNVGYFTQFYKMNNKLAVFDCAELEQNFGKILLDKKMSLLKVSKMKKNKLLFSDFERKPSRARYMHFALQSHFYFNDNLYYWGFPAENIYSLDTLSYEKKTYVHLEFGDRRITEELLDRPWKHGKELYDVMYKNKMYFLDNFFKLKHDVYSFNYRSRYIGIDLKNSNNLLCYNKIQFFDDFNISPVNLKYKIRLIGSAGLDRIIFSWDALDFRTYFNDVKSRVNSEQWGKILQMYPSLEQSLEAVNEYNNPVLMIGKLK